jgi:uncharacterized membrane protein
MQTTLGAAVFGLASLAAGLLDLIWGEFERAHQPIQAWGDHIPGETILAYVAAAVLIAGGIAMLWRKSRKAGALALGVLYAFFTLFWLPRFVTAPTVLGYHPNVYLGVLAGFCTQAILVAAAAIVYAPSPRTVAIARWIFGVSSIAFGLAHLTNAKDNAGLVPTWMPLGGIFWTILTGICFVLAGLAILTRVRDLLATRLLALMLVVFSVVALAPLPIASPHDHTAWGGNAYNLTAVGAVLIFAEALAP